jgi:hypothetical protein
MVPQVPTPLAVSVLLLILLAAPSHAKPVEFSSSSLMFYNGDLQQDAAMGMSPCELYVRRAAAHGSTRIQLVPTHYWCVCGSSSTSIYMQLTRSQHCA